MIKDYVILKKIFIPSEKRNNLPHKSTNQRRSSWSGTAESRCVVLKVSSLPSLVKQWTCIRCLLDNCCRATPICTACGASLSISQTQATQIGVRKCRRLNTTKNNGTKARLDLVTKVTSGSVTRVLDTSTNNVKIAIGNSNNKTEGKNIYYKILILKN
jgi:hypothetical protein